MKKVFKWCLVIALFLLVGAVIYVMIANKSSFEEALDLVFVGAGGVGVGILSFIPIFSKISSISTDTGTQNKRNESILLEFEEINKKFKEQQKEFQLQEEAFKKVVNEQKEQIRELQQTLNNVFSVCKMGFVNNRELVSKGVASEIAKVGESYENESKE